MEATKLAEALTETAKDLIGQLNIDEVEAAYALSLAYVRATAVSRWALEGRMRAEDYRQRRASQQLREMRTEEGKESRTEVEQSA